MLTKLGIKLNTYELDEDNGWQPNLADIERKITPKTRGIVLINPNNPTGAIYSRKTLEAIAEIARKHNLVVFSDEIYDKLLLDEGVPMVAFASADHWAFPRMVCAPGIGLAAANPAHGVSAV